MNDNFKNNLVEDHDFDETLEEDFVSDTPQSIVIDFGTYQYEAIQSVISTVSQLCFENTQLKQQVAVLCDFIEASGLPVPGEIPSELYDDDSPPDEVSDFFD